MYRERLSKSYKEILSEGTQGYPWGYPSEHPEGMEKGLDEVHRTFQRHRTELDYAWKKANRSKWEIARIFHEIVATGSYRDYRDHVDELQKEWNKEHPNSNWRDFPYADIGGMCYDSNPSVLIAFAKEEYGICRTDLYTMLAVYEKFEGNEGLPTEEAARFTFSQLVEMLPLDDEQRKAIQPNWTIKEIRDYKKTLKSADAGAEGSQQSEKTFEQFDLFEKIDAQISPVQTSEFTETPVQTSELKESPVQTSEFAETPVRAIESKYDRFKDYDRDQLCDLILKQEEEIRRLSASKETENAWKKGRIFRGRLELKNREEREKWLLNFFKEHPEPYLDVPELKLRLYRYDFENGSSLIVKEDRFYEQVFFNFDIPDGDSVWHPQGYTDRQVIDWMTRHGKEI